MLPVSGGTTGPLTSRNFDFWHLHLDNPRTANTVLASNTNRGNHWTARLDMSYQSLTLVAWMSARKRALLPCRTRETPSAGSLPLASIGHPEPSAG
jgi:hypothetical protein